MNETSVSAINEINLLDPINWSDDTEDYIDEIVAAIQRQIDSDVEYAETHDDAGSSYLCCLPDTLALRQDYILEQLKAWLEEGDREGSYYARLGISEGFIDTLSDELLDGILESAEVDYYNSIWIPSWCDRFILDSYPIQEVQCEIDFLSLEDDIALQGVYLPIEYDLRQAIFDAAIQRGRLCGTYTKADHRHHGEPGNFWVVDEQLVAYHATDTVWHAYVSLESLETICDDLAERYSDHLAEIETDE